MHPIHHALSTPDKQACILAATGKSISYRELESAANRGAQLLRSLGLSRGDVLAVMLENEIAVFEIAWAAQRAGLYLTSMSTKLSSADAAYILRDSGAKLLIVSDAQVNRLADDLADFPDLQVFTTDAAAKDGFRSWSASCADFPPERIADESPGNDMLYSSGTTGRPKGVKPLLPEGAVDQPTPLVGMGQELYGMSEDTVYLSTSPLYHAAPLRWALTVHRLGGTVVIMERFDAEQALSLIEQYRVTHATWVPTHFIRLLKLPDNVRSNFDHSSLVAAIHAAAPCPVPVKQAMIDWWGPILHEYYAGTESCGITALSSVEWLKKRGSVGKAILGTVKILDDDSCELPPGQTGDIYFADGPKFEYHNDPEKTARAHNAQGWATIGDIGYLDQDGYLFLSDRRNFMIISGGVNIYPQEIENVLVTHPSVADAAVIGAPDPEMGEKVVAIIQPADANCDEAALAEELMQFTRLALGGVKTPRQFDFRPSLPREATGKLMKAALVAEYRGRYQLS